MKIYRVEIIGSDTPTLCTQEDVVKLIAATSKGYRLVLVGGDLVSPSSVARVRRSYGTTESEVESNDGMKELTEGLDKIKALK